MELQKKINEMKAKIEEKIPLEALKTMNRAIEDLKNSDIMQQFLKAGDIAPQFTLMDHTGKEVSSASLLEKGPLVISFYRGIW